MELSNISKWTRRNSIKIVFILFLIEWSLSVLIWISANILLNISGIIFYFLISILATILPYILYKWWIRVKIIIVEDEKKEKEPSSDVELTTDPRNYDLSYAIAIWILARIVDFLEFNEISYLLMTSCAVNFGFVLMIAFGFAGFPELKTILIGILAIICINFVFALYTVFYNFLFPGVGFYDVGPLSSVHPLIFFLVLLIFEIKFRKGMSKEDERYKERERKLEQFYSVQKKFTSIHRYYWLKDKPKIIEKCIHYYLKKLSIKFLKVPRKIEKLNDILNEALEEPTIPSHIRSLIDEILSELQGIK